MYEPYAPKSQILRDWYWEDEILQLLYWLRGEGLDVVVDPTGLQRFLGLDPGRGRDYLDRLAVKGLLARDGAGFTLSPDSLDESAVDLAVISAESLRPARGACSAECWCHLSAAEEAACAAQRRAGGLG